MDRPGVRLLWVRGTDAGEASRVSPASTAANATMPARAARATRARTNRPGPRRTGSDPPRS
ncbi:hypothetical protein STANM309S_05190 [Streptomyces tanashiensis]